MRGCHSGQAESPVNLLKYSLAILQEPLGSGSAGICPKVCAFGQTGPQDCSSPAADLPSDLLSALPIWPGADEALTLSTGHLQPELSAVPCLEPLVRVLGYHIRASSAVSQGMGWRDENTPDHGQQSSGFPSPGPISSSAKRQKFVFVSRKGS